MPSIPVDIAIFFGVCMGMLALSLFFRAALFAPRCPICGATMELSLEEESRYPEQRASFPTYICTQCLYRRTIPFARVRAREGHPVP